MHAIMQSVDKLWLCGVGGRYFFFFFSRSDVNRVDFVSENLRRGRRQGLKDKKNVSRDLGQESTCTPAICTRFVHYLCIESTVKILSLLVPNLNRKSFHSSFLSKHIGNYYFYQDLVIIVCSNKMKSIQLYYCSVDIQKFSEEKEGKIRWKCLAMRLRSRNICEKQISGRYNQYSIYDLYDLPIGKFIRCSLQINLFQIYNMIREKILLLEAPLHNFNCKEIIMLF